MGRRLYETTLYWETADEDPSHDEAVLEWTALWKPLPKVSTTLDGRATIRYALPSKRPSPCSSVRRSRCIDQGPPWSATEAKTGIPSWR